MKLIANSTVTIGDQTFKPGDILPAVDAAEAQQLLDVGYAVQAPAEQPEPGTIRGHLDAEQLSTMSFSELKQMAEDMEVDTAGLNSKAKLAAAIAAVEIVADADEKPEGGDEDGADV